MNNTWQDHVLFFRISYYTILYLFETEFHKKTNLLTSLLVYSGIYMKRLCIIGGLFNLQIRVFLIKLSSAYLHCVFFQSSAYLHCLFSLLCVTIVYNVEPNKYFFLLSRVNIIVLNLLHRKKNQRRKNYRRIYKSFYKNVSRRSVNVKRKNNKN